VALDDAFARPGRDVTLRLGGVIDARLLVPASGEEIWVVIATQAADGRFVDATPVTAPDRRGQLHHVRARMTSWCVRKSS